VGYGITSAEAIKQALPHLGVELVTVQPRRRRWPDLERQRLAWLIDGQKALLSLDLSQFDLIFIFHSFQHFPAEVRRILFDLKSPLPIAGYTHGSHWDPTDVFRTIHYPGMEVVDLANLLCLDRVLLPSYYLRDVLLENIGRWKPEVAKQLEPKLAVVGLPINTNQMDAFHTTEKFERPTIVFNHALIPSKAPTVFLEIAEELLERHDVNVIITRHAEDESVAALLQRLSKRFPHRFLVGETYSLPDYFRLLWKADLQVSTAIHEGLGIATLEAMYTENCCLLPNCCSYPEITGGFQDVLYNSREELLDKIDYFLKNEAERRKVACELRRRSLRYAPEQVASRLYATFSEILRV